MILVRARVYEQRRAARVDEWLLHGGRHCRHYIQRDAVGRHRRHPAAQPGRPAGATRRLPALNPYSTRPTRLVAVVERDGGEALLALLAVVAGVVRADGLGRAGAEERHANHEVSAVLLFSECDVQRA